MSTFVGFGFGAIQAGLFLYEAQQSGAFARLVVAEVLPERVRALRATRGYYSVNIAHADRIEVAQVGPVDVYNPNDAEDRTALLHALAAASEAATALPSVKLYGGDPRASAGGLIAAGLQRKAALHGPPLTLYCAENHAQAAQLLRRAVGAACADPALPARVNFLDTVIGKMSGIVPAAGGLAPMMPGVDAAFLVEAFNRILVGGVEGAGSAGPGAWADAFVRKLSIFAHKQDLAPFEAAKLYCHNAGHATAGYLGLQAGLTRMDQLAEAPDILAVTRRAMVDEAGAALVANHAGKDPLFTDSGMAAYADDLLQRMVNPYLRDGIARVTRDPARKLGWDDRLIGAMRMALAGGIAPDALAQGALAAFHAWQTETGRESSGPAAIRRLWPPTADREEQDAVMAALQRAG